MGPNIVMGAFSMPVDVVGATQVVLSKCKCLGWLFTKAHESIPGTCVLHLPVECMHLMQFVCFNNLKFEIILPFIMYRVWCRAMHTCICCWYCTCICTSCILKVAEYSFSARFCWCKLARAQGFQKTNIPSTERSFNLLNTRTICVIFLYNCMQCIDGSSILLCYKR